MQCIRGGWSSSASLTNTFGGGLTDTPPWDTLEVTWFDNSPSSAIVAVLLQVDNCTGAVTVLCNVSSVDTPTNTCAKCGFPAGSINFANSHYFVQVRLARGLTTVTPQMIGLRIR